jgi:DNA replication protein DnaC
MPDEEGVDTPLDTQWDEDIPGYESLLQEMLEVLQVHGNSAAPSGILLTGCTGVAKSWLASCIAYHYTQDASMFTIFPLKI